MSRHTVIFSNQKGGVGKTTLTRELGIYLSSRGHEVLLIDCDPQGNLTKSLLERDEGGLYAALSGEGLEPVSIERHLTILGGDFRLALLEKSLIGEIDAYSRIKEILADAALNSFDFIFLDTPPSLGVFTVNALAAASNLVIPMNPSLYSMQGTNDLLRTVSKVRTNLNPSLSKSIRIEEAIATRRGVIHHKHLGESRAAEEVASLGEELFSRLEGSASQEVRHDHR
jgi:chromosome partitioning protein